MVLAMRIMPAALALAAATSANAAERRYTVTDFDKIQVEGPFEVAVTTGRAPAARATGTTKALELVTIDMQGRTLRVRTNRAAWGGYPGESIGPVKLEFTTHGLRAGSVSGSGSLAIDKVEAMKLELALSGSGRLHVGEVETDNLLVHMFGSGKISVAGKAKELRATIQGTGDFDAAGLSVSDAQLTSDSSGAVGVAVKRTAKVTALGTGDIIVSGSPDCTLKVLGSGHVACGKAPR